MSSDPPRLTIGIIGAGKVGAVLGAAWEGAGHRVTAYSAGESSAAAARELLPAARRVEPQEVPAEADAVVVGVPSRDAPALIRGLAETGAWRAGQIVVHTIPGHGVELFSPLTQQGTPVLALALHPAMVFSGHRLDVERLRDTVVGYVCPPELDSLGQSLILDVGATPLALRAVDLPRHDAAVTVATEGLAALVHTVRQSLAAGGVPEPDLVAAPLLRAALEAALGSGEAPPGTSPSGPVATWDAPRAAAQLRAAADPEAPESLHELVESLTRAAARHSLATRIQPPPSALGLLREVHLEPSED